MRHIISVDDVQVVLPCECYEYEQARCVFVVRQHPLNDFYGTASAFDSFEKARAFATQVGRRVVEVLPLE